MGAVASELKTALNGVSGESVLAGELALGLPTRFEGKRAAVQVRRAGRPAGSVNLPRRQMMELFARKGVDPLLEMARWLQHTPQSLASELRCSQLEAFDRLQGLRRDLAPFIYGKAAPVDEDGQPVPMFNLTIGGMGGGGDVAPWLRTIVQDQGLGDDEAAQSHGAASHGEAK